VRSLLLCLALGGCSLTLDEAELTQGEDADVTLCDDFTPNDLGGQDAWKVFSGTWKVTADTDAGAVYEQTQPPANNNVYKTMFGSMGWRRVGIVAELTAAGGDGLAECVMGRVIDRDHFYRLCLENGAQWRLARVEKATVTTLKSGPLDYVIGSRHVLALDARGTQLTATVDGLTPVDVNDRFFQQGASGFATETTTTYHRLCVHVQ
jgi:hypothetical protein